MPWIGSLSHFTEDAKFGTIHTSADNDHCCSYPFDQIQSGNRCCIRAFNSALAVVMAVRQAL